MRELPQAKAGGFFPIVGLRLPIGSFGLFHLSPYPSQKLSYGAYDELAPPMSTHVTYAPQNAGFKDSTLAVASA